jgi:DNA-binding NarL/FixJ family response regulator
MTNVRIVVVDDHALFRAGLVSLLEDMPEFSVVGEAANGRDAMIIIKQAHPDVVLMDVNMPIMNGIEAVRLLKRGESCRILMLTISKNEEDLFGAISAGADGYLLKNAEPEELKRAILQVVEGHSVLAPEVTQPILKAVANLNLQGGAKGISRRELEVLECLAQGLTTAQISARLFVSENTVKTHIRHILEKLEASNRTEAVSKATQIGLLKSE